MQNQNRKRKTTVIQFALGLLALSSTSVFAAVHPASGDPAFPITNNTGFYLNNSAPNEHPGCPAQIAPGTSAVLHDYWCGYVACATKDYSTKDPSDGGGCLENSDHTGTNKTQGGYATYFSVSPGATPKLCTVPTGNTYSCLYDQNNVLTIQYLPVQQTYSAGTKVGQVVTLDNPVVSYPSGTPQFRGVNISGMEYDGTFLDALFQHPDIPDVRYFAAQGMNTVRFPIRWEFLISDPGNSVNSHDPNSATPNMMYIQAVHDTLQKYLQAGLTVDLDLHNYMRFCPTGTVEGQTNEPTDPVDDSCQLVNAEQFAHIWSVITEQFGDLAQQYPKQLVFELMNEPFYDPAAGQQLKTADLLNDEAAAVKAIRSNTAYPNLQNLILLSGNYWDPLHDWTTNQPDPNDVTNAAVFTAANIQAAGITGNYAIDMHQYFDKDFSGRSDTCNDYGSYANFEKQLGLSDGTGNDLLTWIKANHMKVFLGEFGAADNATCQQDLNYMLQFVNENAYGKLTTDSGFIGWTAWRSNRHGAPNAGFSWFNFLQQEDDNVYGGNGTKPASPNGTGIAGGAGNGLMQDTFAKYLTAPQ